MGMPLRREAPEYSLSLSLSLGNAPRVAFYSLCKQSYRFLVFYSFRQDFKQYDVVNTIKELSHVAFEHIARASVIPAYFADHVSQIEHAAVSALADPAGKRSGDACFLKHRIEHCENCMVQYPVPHGRLEDITELWITNPKRLVWSVPVSVIPKVSVKLKDVSLEMLLERAFQLR